jgi:WD40 repeat protein
MKLRTSKKLLFSVVLMIAVSLLSAFFLIKAKHNQPVLTIQASSHLFSASYSPDGKILATSGGESCLITLWSTENGSHIREFKLCPENRAIFQRADSIAFSPDGNHLLVAGRSYDFAQILNSETGETISFLTGLNAFVSAVAWSFDGSRVVTTSENGTFKVWDAMSGNELYEHSEALSSINCASFDSTGNMIVSGNDDGDVSVWSASTGEEIINLIGHTDSVQSCHFSPDGNTILTSSYDKSVREWSTTDGNELRRFDYDGWVLDASYSFDGEVIVAGIWFYDDIFLIDAVTGNSFDHFNHSEPQHGHLSFVTFSPVGNHFASGAGDTIKIWNYENP